MRNAFDAAASTKRASGRGLGPGNREFFWVLPVKWHRADGRVPCGPKKLECIPAYLHVHTHMLARNRPRRWRLKSPCRRFQGPYCEGVGDQVHKELNRPAPPPPPIHIHTFGRNNWETNSSIHAAPVHKTTKESISGASSGRGVTLQQKIAAAESQLLEQQALQEKYRRILRTAGLSTYVCRVYF